MRAVLLIIFCCIASIQAQAQVDPSRLDDIQREQQKAEEAAKALEAQKQGLTQDIEQMKSRLIDLGASVRDLGQTVSELEIDLAALEVQEAALEQQIFTDREKLSQFLGALQRSQREPPAALMLSPSRAVYAARSARLMAAYSQDLSVRSEGLKADLSSLGELRVDIVEKRASLLRNAESLEAQRAEIRTLVDQKTSLSAQVDADRRASVEKAQKLADEAQNLRELIARFEDAARNITPRLKPDPKMLASRPRVKPRIRQGEVPLELPDTVTRFAQARGLLRSPVAGRIVKNFSADNLGLTLTADSKASVIAPYAGRVEFAGAFKNYDNVIILNVGDGYFILMTGLGEIFTQAGETVFLGEPLGALPAGTSPRPSLYLELRKDGVPVNPKPWIGTAFAEAG